MSRERRKRPGSSTAAVKASAVSWPTPGMLISRRQASDALTIPLMSASIATMAASTAARAATRPRIAADTGDALARLERLPDEGGAERTGQSDAEHHRKAADLVLQSDPLTDQLLVSDDQRPDSVCRQGLHKNRLEEAGAGQMRQAACIVAVGLVRRPQLQRLRPAGSRRKRRVIQAGSSR